MVTSDPPDLKKKKKTKTKKKVFVKWVLHGIKLPLHQNLIYWLSPTSALEQSLRAIWDAASGAAVLILPQINLQLSSCTSFFADNLLQGILMRGWKPWLLDLLHCTLILSCWAIGEVGFLQKCYSIISSFSNFYISNNGEGDGTPLQNSCLENPMDGGAW